MLLSGVILHTVLFLPTFSPLFYGIRDVTYPIEVYQDHIQSSFSPLFYGIRDVTDRLEKALPQILDFQSPILRDS